MQIRIIMQKIIIGIILKHYDKNSTHFLYANHNIIIKLFSILSFMFVISNCSISKNSTGNFKSGGKVSYAVNLQCLMRLV